MTLNDFIAERTEMLNRFRRYAEGNMADFKTDGEGECMTKDDWMRELEYFLEATEE